MREYKSFTIVQPEEKDCGYDHLIINISVIDNRCHLTVSKPGTDRNYKIHEITCSVWDTPHVADRIICESTSRTMFNSQEDLIEHLIVTLNLEVCAAISVALRTYTSG